MSGAFRYALEPVRLTRQWDLDALLLALEARNAALAMRQGELDALRLQTQDASREWRQLGQDAQLLSVDRFMLLSRYIDACRQRERSAEQQVAQLEQQRDAVIDEVMAARRALDAVEQHRDEMWLEYVRHRQSGDFKLADDQWGVLQTGKLKHDDES